MSTDLFRSRVQIYTYNNVITGCIEHLPNLRLLDHLNYSQRKYITVSAANVSSASNTNLSFNIIHVNMDNIFFIKEIENGKNNSLKEEGKGDFYPYVRKFVVDIQFFMPAYKLCGKMHLGKGQSPDDILNSSQVFFPLTDVEISSPANEPEKNIDFVAVNSHQILLLAEIQA